MKPLSVKAECDACDGTGLYSGFAEPSGHAAVCSVCGGTGCEVIRYHPWSGRRKGKRGIHTVALAWNRGTPITYAQFVAGKFPKRDTA